MKIVNHIVDKYLSAPIFVDFVLVSLLWILTIYFPIPFVLTDRANQISILPYIISTDVSLAGFILAALTIIITFRSNIQSKGMESATNALEMILSSSHYLSIIKVFKKSLIEFIICFICLFLFWLSVDNFEILTINKVNFCGIILTGLSITRSLCVLFSIMGLSGNKNIF